jgi:hypothetical protein
MCMSSLYCGYVYSGAGRGSGNLTARDRLLAAWLNVDGQGNLEIRYYNFVWGIGILVGRGGGGAVGDWS